MIHKSALVEEDTIIGSGVQIWMDVQIRRGAEIGKRTIVGKGVYIGLGVHIGKDCKIQNFASLFRGAIVEDGVFIGPYTCFTNDKVPRAVNPDMTLKSTCDWELLTTRVRVGAAIGASSVILPGITIGEWAMVGAGSIVTRDVPDYTLVSGNPARAVARICRCGTKLPLDDHEANCPVCGWCT